MELYIKLIRLLFALVLASPSCLLAASSQDNNDFDLVEALLKKTAGLDSIDDLSRAAQLAKQSLLNGDATRVMESLSKSMNSYSGQNPYRRATGEANMLTRLIVEVQLDYSRICLSGFGQQWRGLVFEKKEFEQMAKLASMKQYLLVCDKIYSTDRSNIYLGSNGLLANLDCAAQPNMLYIKDNYKQFLESLLEYLAAMEQVQGASWRALRTDELALGVQKFISEPCDFLAKADLRAGQALYKILMLAEQIQLRDEMIGPSADPMLLINAASLGVCNKFSGLHQERLVEDLADHLVSSQ